MTYAVLEDEGYAKLREAADTHLGGVRRRFGERFSDEELGTLAELLGRLGFVDDGAACAPE